MTESIQNLKEYLMLRDFREECAFLKEKNKLGVPMILFNDKIYFETDLSDEIVKEMKCTQG